MTEIYLESSAVLRDLLDGDDAETIRDILRAATHVAVSRLTLAEVDRVMARLRALEPEIASNVAARHAQFETETELWSIHPVDDGIWARCGRPFPVEPVRMLDAIHLATIERLSGVLTKLVVVSTDARVRQNAIAFGFPVIPEPTPEDRK